MTNHYHIFGLDIESAIPLPAAPVSGHSGRRLPDVVIKYGNPPDHLANPQSKNARYQARPGEFLLRVDSVARYYVRDGRHIVVAPEPGAEDESVLIYLLGSAFGALLHQRNILVLHAGAIETKNRSVLFTGDSGIGKSTLAAGFHKRGYPFLADDVCAVGMINRQPAVIPGFPRLKLWADVLTKLEHNKDQLKSVRWTKGMDKYFLPVDPVHKSPVLLKSVFVLEAAKSDEINITRLTGAEKINFIIKNTYRLQFLNGLGGKEEHFRQCAAVASRTNVYRVVRPDKGFLLDKLMDALEEKF